MIRLILVILTALFAFSFAMMNSDQTVTLSYFFGISTGPLPLYQVILGTLLVGVFLVVILLIPEWVRLHLQLRRQRRALEEVELELSRLKSQELPRPSSSQRYEDSEI